ncbi:MAG: cysteine peptidase family C39 domain-containing protein [Patescibacteria group bacterium]
MKFLEVKSYQESVSCGPAVLKMILDFYEIKKTEAELAKIAGTTKKEGTEIVQLKKVFKYFGFKVKTKVNSTYEDLQSNLSKNIPVIVGWYTKGKQSDPENMTADGHYSVVIGLDKKFVYLQDPEIGKIRKLKREDFLIVWLDYFGEYPKTKKDIFLRPSMAVYK